MVLAGCTADKSPFLLWCVCVTTCGKKAFLCCCGLNIVHGLFYGIEGRKGCCHHKLFAGVASTQTRSAYLLADFFAHRWRTIEPTHVCFG